LALNRNLSEMNLKKRPLCFLIIFFLIFLLLQNFLLAENARHEDKLDKEFLIKFGEDFKKTLFSPKYWDKKDFLTFSAVLGTGVLFYAFDQEIHDWVQDQRSSASDDVSGVLSNFGNGVFLTGLIAALYASGELSDNNSLRRTALLSLESFVTSGVIVIGLKFIGGRARPKTGESKDTFHFFSTKSSYNSFPSGHATSAFAVATTIADQSENAFVDISAYSLATLAALSRVHDNKHWFSDVFFGSAIGYFVAKKICSLNRDQNSARLEVSLNFGENSQSFSVILCF
jgi:hypothetical protein